MPLVLSTMCAKDSIVEYKLALVELGHDVNPIIYLQILVGKIKAFSVQHIL